MDDEKLEGVAGEDLDQSMQQTTGAIRNVADKTVGKAARTAGDKAKEFAGEKIRQTRAARKIQAVKHEVQQGTKKTIKGATTSVRGSAQKAAGAALSKAAAGIAATGAGAPVAEALNKKAQALQTKGALNQERGKQKRAEGLNRLKNAPNADPDQAPSNDDDSDDNEDLGVPNPKKTINMFKNMLKDLLKALLKKYKWIIIGVLAGIIGLFLLVVLIASSKEKTGKYIEGDYSNVPFVIDSMILDRITIASDGQGAYRYAVEDDTGNIISIDEAIDNTLELLEENGAESTLNYLGSTNNSRKKVLKKMIQAEMATQFPDLNIQGVGNYQGTVNWGGETISNGENGLEARTFTFSDGETWNYYLYIPQEVNENKPLIVYQHGNGHQGHDFSMLSGSGSDHSFSYLISRGESFNTYVLEPQLPNGHYWDNNDVDKLKSLVDHVVAENGINPNRVSLWGFSMGSERIEYNVNKYPDTYSSMVICARNTGVLQGNVRSDFPIYLVYDGSDGYSNGGTPGLYSKLTSAGYSNVQIHRLNEGMGHYETVTRAIHNQELMSWALGQAGSNADLSQLTQGEPVTEDTPVGENFVSTVVDEKVQWGWITQWENPESYYYRNGFGLANYDDPAVNLYITEDGSEYIVQNDPSQGLWVGQGVELNEDNLAKLSAHGINVENIEAGSTMNAEAVDEVSLEIFRERKAYVTEEAKKRELELSENQIIALLNIYYENGNIDKQLDKIADLGADNNKIAKKVNGFANCDEDEVVTSRKELNWKLYKYGLYESAGVFDERYFNGMEEAGSRVSSRVFKGKNTFNGTIHVQRRDEDGNDVDLSYTDEKTFNQMISEKSDEALNYYTLKKTKKTKKASSGAASQGELFTYIASWENGPLLQYQNGRGSYNNGLVQGYITEDGQSYICRTDEGLNNGTKNYGYGVMVNQYGVPNNVEYFAEQGIDITDAQYLKEHISTIPVETVNNISMKIMNDKVETLNRIADAHGVTLTTNQQHALVDVMYQFGDGGANLNRFMELYKQYGDTEALRDNYTSLGGVHVFKYVIGGTYDGVQRGESHWLLFHNGEYHYGVEVDWDVTSGNTSTSNSSENESSSDSSSSSAPNVEGGKVDSNGVTITSDGNHEFLQAAIAAHEYGRNKGLTYSGAGRDVLPNASTPSNYTYTDCSTYVSFALEWYGFTEWRNYSWQESTGNYHELVPSSIEKLGNEKMETVFSGNAGNISEIPNIQSGDIVIIPGHTQIFYGYNSSGAAVWLNAGSTGAIAREEGKDAYNDIIGGFGKYITKVYRVPDGSGNSSLRKITSLDNFLFIGDSRYSTVSSIIETLGSGINNQGVGSARVDEWLSVANNGGKGTVQEKSVDITGDYPGISVQLGANSVYGGGGAGGAADEMKEFLNKLKELHPGTPIFVNSCLGVNSNAASAGYSWDATDMMNRINEFNSAVSAFCNQNSDLYYVDISEGLMDENGFVKSEYESDGLHLTNSEARNTFAENIKKGILEIGASLGNKDEEDKTSDDTTYVILVANRKDSNTVTTENYEYQYSYGINKSSGVTSGGLGKQYATPSERMISSTSSKQYSSSKVDYQEALKKNTLYFDFLWALLVDSSGDTILVSDLADLAIKSDVDLTAYTENVETQSTNSVNSGTLPVTNYNASSTMAYYDMYNVVRHTTTVTKTITSKCAITKADTWLVDYENNAKDYNTFKKRTEEKISEKTDSNSSKVNPVIIFRRDFEKLGELQKSEYIMERMLQENTKVDFMIDVYKYVLSVAAGDEEVKTNLSGIGLLDTSLYDLSNSNNLVAKMQLMYNKLNLDDDDKELLYKAVEKICGQYGDGEENTERKKLVTSVILNRAMSSEYPNSVKKVLKQRRQFPGFKYSDISGDISISESTKSAVDEVIEKGDCSNLSTIILPVDSEVDEDFKTTEVDDEIFKYGNTDEIAQELRKYQVIVGYVRGSRKGRSGNYSEGFTPEEDPYNTGTMGIYKLGDRAYSTYIQGNNSLWAGIPYSHENMAGSACGATSVAIIASSVDPDITPIESGKAIYEHIGAQWGTNANGATDISSLSAALNKFGIKHEWRNGVSKEDVIAHLEQGLPVIVLVHDRTVGDAHYGGHYLTLLGLNDQGDVFVGDPARGGKNTMYHSQDKLNISGLWVCFITFD